MGSSPKKKSSRQPKRVVLRGGGLQRPAEFPGPTGMESSRLLEVPLRQVRAEVLRQSRVGDRVSIMDTGDKLLVTRPRGILGEVPPHFEDTLRDGRVSAGVLRSADSDEPSATIAVRLTT